VELLFFLKTCGLLVLIEICLFFGLFFGDLFCGLLFSQNLWHFCFSIYCYRHIGRVFMKICSFWACSFAFPSLLSYLIFLIIFCFVEFSCQRMLDLFFGEITYFWLVFQIYLLVFAKQPGITVRHQKRNCKWRITRTKRF